MARGNVFATKAPDTVSWYRRHLETSLALIEQTAEARNASIIDVGGGESSLVDDLLLRTYKNLTVLDVSQTAIEVTKKRLGSAAEQVVWLVGDIVRSGWNNMPTIFGMTEPYSIFLRDKRNCSLRGLRPRPESSYNQSS